jgi:hypothetical protein
MAHFVIIEKQFIDWIVGRLEGTERMLEPVLAEKT